jgi:hypothetical protein
LQIFSLFGEILLKDNGVSSELDKIDKKASGIGKSMGSSFSGIASAALKVGAVLGAGMGISDMISKASSAEKAMAQMDAVLKSTSGAAGMSKDALVALADSQGKLTTFSKGANVETENLLLTFTSIGKDVFPTALKTVNDMSTALGQDTKSSAIQLGKALQDPIAGITALKRVGVNFTDAQKEQIKTLMDSGQVMKAQQVILAELGKEFGGSAEAAGKTFGGQLEIAKNQISGVGAAIASALLPTLTSLLTVINTNMPKIKQVVTDVVTVVADKFKEWITIIGQIVNELFPSLGKTTDDVKGKSTGFSDALGLVTKALTFVRDNITLVKVVLEALGVMWVIHKGYILANNVALLAHNVIQAAGILLNGTDEKTTGLATVARIAHTAATNIGTVAVGLFNAVMVAGPILLVIAVLVLLGAAIYEIVKHWDAIKEKTKEVWDAITKGVTEAVKSIKDAIVKGFNSAIEFITSLPGKAVQWGKDFVQGIIDGIVSMIDGVINAVKDIANKIGSFLHFSKPDVGPLADYETWMPDFMGGLAKGIDANKYKVINAVKGLTGNMKVNANITSSTGAGSSMSGNNSGLGATNYYTFAPGSIIIPAKDLDEMRTIQDFFGRLPQVSRAGG